MPRLSDMDLTQRAIERGWLSALPKDPGEDPPDLKYLQLPREPKEPKP